MTPRTLKLNAHRSLTYYTPEDVAELQRQLDQAIIHLKIGDDALALVRGQRDEANRRVGVLRAGLRACANDIMALTARCQRLTDEIEELRGEDDDER